MNRRITLLAIFLLSQISCSKIILFGPKPDKIRSRKDFNWIEEHTDDNRFTFLIEKGVQLQGNLKERDITAHQHLNKCFGFINEQDRNESYTYVIVSSRKRVEDLAGDPNQALAFPARNLVIGETVAPMGAAHELFHVVSIRCWGQSETWMQEGLAVAVDNNWRGNDLHALAKFLKQNGRLIPLNELIKHFRKQDSFVAYPEAGSFCRFLYETYGAVTVRDIWKSGTNNIHRIVGKDINSLETDWLAKIDQANTTCVNYKVHSK